MIGMASKKYSKYANTTVIGILKNDTTNDIRRNNTKSKRHSK